MERTAQEGRCRAPIRKDSRLQTWLSQLASMALIPEELFKGFYLHATATPERDLVWALMSSVLWRVPDMVAFESPGQCLLNAFPVHQLLEVPF